MHIRGSMRREIVTQPISTEQIHQELVFLVEYFKLLGHTQCEVVFGSAWGIDYYPGNDWHVVQMPLEELIPEVRRVEAAGEWGGLGSNDLYITRPPLDLDFRFCSDSDIHLSFDQPSEITESFYQRWKERGYSPAEYVKSENLRLRFE